MRYSPAVTMAAIALCSAQKPVPLVVSMHTPPKELPASVRSTAATSPNNRLSAPRIRADQGALPEGLHLITRRAPASPSVRALRSWIPSLEPPGPLTGNLQLVSTPRRTVLVLVAAAAFGALAAGAKGQAGDGVALASQLRGAVGNLSTPWVLLPLVAGASARRLRTGAVLGLAATMLALTTFYAVTGVVVSLDGRHFLSSALAWAAANRRYYLAGALTGPVCGAAGAWWRLRTAARDTVEPTVSVGRLRSVKPPTSGRQLLMLTGLLLLGEPLVLLALGVVAPAGTATSLLPPLLRLLGGWGMSLSAPTPQLAVYAGETVCGAFAVIAAARRRPRTTP
ncbi:MAG: hypothetical protein ACR2GG_01985 [Gemmatimonadaceae bacterium]